MDALVRLHLAAHGLLTTVDDTLARCGAPAEHAIWRLLRKGGLLPGDAIAGAVSWAPQAFTHRADLLRQQHSQQADLSVSLAASAGWEGEAAAAFHARLAVARRDLTVAAESSLAMAGCFDELAAWLVGARLRLAHKLAATLSSAEAVTLKLGIVAGLPSQTVQASAAAEIGVVLLSEVDLFWEGGLEISERWEARLEAAVALEAPAVQASATLHVDY
ncbi:MAG TPA: hypothetical protein DGT23_08285 [Micromonosporaceae bacterium]|nr:hypothetical protein [Micromonosporaceae bacterium]